MAEHLVVSEHTVKNTLAAVYRKLGAGNRIEALREASRRGYFEETHNARNSTGVVLEDDAYDPWTEQAERGEG